MLTMERAQELNAGMVTEDHLILHELNVCYAMAAMARQYPEEHLEHTEKELLAAGVDPEDVRAILSHGYGHRNDIVPVTNMEKSLYTVDELTGIIQACARMRPNGIQDLEVKSFMKKFKDKKFAAKCNRELILKGCEMLGMELKNVAEICIEGMKEHAQELQLMGNPEG